VPGKQYLYAIPEQRRTGMLVGWGGTAGKIGRVILRSHFEEGITIVCYSNNFLREEIEK